MLSKTEWSQVRELSKLDLERIQAAFVKQFLGLGTLAGVALWYSGRDLSWWVIFVTFMTVVMIPAVTAILIAKDKQDGTFELLLGLPATGWTLALGRVRALLLASMLAGVAMSATFIVLWPFESSFSVRLGIVTVGFLLGWMVTLAIGVILMWIGIRFKPETAMVSPLLVLILGTFALEQAGLDLQPIWEWVTTSQLLRSNSGVLLIGTGVVIVSVAVTMIGAWLLGAALERSRARIHSTV